MPVTLTYPGVYIEEVPSGVRTITGVATSITAFIGRTLRGPVVTAEYFGRPAATRLAKIHDPKTGALWHRMGDVGYYDHAGRLWFCGRKSHRVVTPHGTLFTDQVEPVFNAAPRMSTRMPGERTRGHDRPAAGSTAAMNGPGLTTTACKATSNGSGNASARGA